jgi:hypothetical protein
MMFYTQEQIIYSLFISFDSESLLLVIFPREALQRNAIAPEDKHQNVHRSIINNNPKLEKYKLCYVNNIEYSFMISFDLYICFIHFPVCMMYFTTFHNENSHLYI